MVTEPFTLQNTPPPTPPACSKCGLPTRLTRIEPTGEPDYNLRTYECETCGNIDRVKVRFR